MSATSTGFRAHLVLRHKPTAPVVARFRVHLAKGMSIAPSPGGGFMVSDELAGTVLQIAAPLMWDASKNAAGDPGRMAPVEAKLVTVDGQQMLELTPDARFLEQASYPVTVDPDVTAPGVRDTFVNSGAPDTSYGSAPYLRVGLEGTTKKRSFAQYETPDLAGAQITSASYRLYNYHSESCTPKTLSLWPVTEPWTISATWNTQPTVSSTSPYAVSKSFAHGGSVCANAYESIDVTSPVRAWADGKIPNYGWTLRASETDAAAFKSFCSGNEDTTHTSCNTATRSPLLTVTWDPDVVRVSAPTVVHSNGAELRWSRFAGTTFDRYEVHRSTTAGFTPTASTLLTTIQAEEVTRYTDSTAKPGTTFRYQVTANGKPSNEISVLTPAAGEAKLTLQPDSTRGRATQLIKADGQTGCTYAERNWGAGATLRVGVHTSTSVGRTLLNFNTRDIPVGATVKSAALKLSYPSATDGRQSRQVNLHRNTRAWSEGTANGTCNGSGASWNEAASGEAWTDPAGGDFDSATIASVPAKARTTAGTDTYTVTSLVQQWAKSEAPNHGMILKYASETIPTSGVWYFDYLSDDDPDPNLRPKLEVTYTDDSVSRGPRVVLSSPGKDAQVAGSSVKLAATAADDRRVDKVEFLIDGTLVGSDTTAPYDVLWNSTTVANGQRSITVKATDDVGNVTTSAAVPITVDNTAKPTGALTAPASGATVSGTTETISATASDDAGVAKVEFLVDGDRVGAPDTTAPYSISWNTLDPLARIFDGSHEITAAITDTSGQTTITSPRTVTVNNRGSSKFKAWLKLNDPANTADDVFPQLMTEDPTAPTNDPYAGTTLPDGTAGGSAGKGLWSAPPARGNPSSLCPDGAYCPTVTVTNTSGQSWQNADNVDLWYAWYAPNGARLFEGPAVEKFPNQFAAGDTKTFNVVIKPPALPPGAELGDYRLRIDLYDTGADTNGDGVADGEWFSRKGNPPIDHPIQVAKKIDDNLGLERFWHYDGESLGAGMSTMTNVANGNMLWRWSPFFAPGRGLSTMLDLTYNAREDHSKSPAGNNVSLAISGLIRFGEPLDIHPNKADEISGKSNKWVEFVDGDGTLHRFTWDSTTGQWKEPPGVNLYLNSLADGDPQGRKWKLVRPDKVAFYFDAEGYPVSVEDRNTNKITFKVDPTPAGEDPGGPKRRITKVTDAGGRSFDVDYYSKDEAKRAHVRGNIQRITDHSGSVLDFDYYDDGNLLRLIQQGGSKANGEHLPDRSFVFTYTTASGKAAAIPVAADRVDPNPRTPNQSTRIFSVRDPRGHETTYDYYGPSEGPHDRWKLQKRTNREGHTTSYGYNITSRITTVTAPAPTDQTRITKYSYDTDGKVTKINDPAGRDTLVSWTSDFKVSKVTEPSTKTTQYTYNPNGYLTSQTNQLNETTKLDYTDSPADSADTGNHLSLLKTVTTPRGVATADPTTDFQWRFEYDADGNVDKAIDPTGATTDYDYNLAGSPDPGTIARIYAPNESPNRTTATEFNSYDPSGQPTKITDAEGNVTRFVYDADGQLRSVQDPNHAGDTGSDERAYKSFFDYDAFHRLGRQSAPKSTKADRGNLIWSGADFDANDNTVTTIDPHYGPAADDPEGAPTGSNTYDKMDRPLVIANSDKSVDPLGERTTLEYDPAGRVKQVTDARGVLSAVEGDHTTIPTYDELDRVRKQTVFGTSATEKRITHNCYDQLTGDLTSVTLPRAGLETVNCADTTRPFTWTYAYDDAHRITRQTDPEDRKQTVTYDKNSNPITTEGDIDAANGRFSKTTNTYDPRDELEKIEQSFASSRKVITQYRHDANGNRTKLISPRAHDANGNIVGEHYITTYEYDRLNRLKLTKLPFDSNDGVERQYVHQGYDANGNLTSTSLPVTESDPTKVGDGAKTKMTHFDPGWIRTSGDPVNPHVQFDYTAQGWQTERVPDTPGGDDQTMRWSYFNDGQIKNRRDQGGQPALYTYDANNNMLTAIDAAGLTDPSEKAVSTQATYTGFDEPDKIRFRKDVLDHTVNPSKHWTYSDYTYDHNGNITERLENGTESGPITSPTAQTAPRQYKMTFDDADWVEEQLDLGTTSSCSGDQRLKAIYFDSGWQRQRDHYRADASCTAETSTWKHRQRTTADHFDNGKLRTKQTFTYDNSEPQKETETEHHDVGYIDNNGRYVNGHRVSDRFWRKQPSGGSTCASSAAPCDATYTYDARDRVTKHQLRADKVDTYTFDEQAQLLGDNTIRAGNVTKEVKADGTTTTRKYEANQLKEATVTKGTTSTTSKSWYDQLGNLDCVTTKDGTQSNCLRNDDGSTSANLLTDYNYDYLNRMSVFSAYSAGSRTDRGVYTYDALDRTITEVEGHAGTDKDRTTKFTYQGLTNLVTEEDQTGGANPKLKTYTYDNNGHRLSLTDKNKTNGEVNTYTYGRDVHGSVSQLIGVDGPKVAPARVEASYGYEAYGGEDDELTTGDPDNQTPLNPYRYTDKRMDSATATGPDSDAQYDMGARRWTPNTSQFAQQDIYYGALANLGLATDQLTQNRYSLAGGNPISYVEYDGHEPCITNCDEMYAGSSSGDSGSDGGHPSGGNVRGGSGSDSNSGHPAAGASGPSRTSDRQAATTPKKKASKPILGGCRALTGNTFECSRPTDPEAGFLKKHRDVIEDAARDFGIKREVLAALLIQEGGGRDKALPFVLLLEGIGEILGKNKSVGIGQMRADVAITLYEKYGGTPGRFNKGSMRGALARNDRFAIRLAAANLYDLKKRFKISDRQAYSAYAGSETLIKDWLSGNQDNPYVPNLVQRDQGFSLRVRQASTLWIDVDEAGGAGGFY